MSRSGVRAALAVSAVAAAGAVLLAVKDRSAFAEALTERGVLHAPSAAPADTAIWKQLKWRSIGPDHAGRSIAISGVKGQPIKGDAEPALKRGDGDAQALGLGLIHDPHNPANTETGNPYLIGELPAELGMHMDMATGIAARSADKKNAAAFIAFALSQEMRGVWRAKGIARY